MRIYISAVCQLVLFVYSTSTTSEMAKNNNNVGIWLVILLAAVDAQRTTTVTRTTTSTITDTVTYLSNVVCAKLVNVTGVCRRRRGLPIDEPVILTFDDQLEEAVDQAFYHALHPGQFVPTRTLGVEVTPLVLLPVVTHSEDDYGVHHPLMTGVAADVNAVQPSMMLERPRYTGRNKMNDGDQSGGGISPAETRIYFAQLAAIANAIGNVFRPPVTRTSTITALTTRVTTLTKFSTTSFFVMGCTPRPFPFSVCAAKRSVDSISPA